MTSGRPGLDIRRIGRGVLALLAGVIIGTLLVTIEIQLIKAWNDAHHIGLKLEAGGIAVMSVYFGLLYGSAIAAASAAVWMVLGRFGRSTRIDAVLVGLVMTLLVWFVLPRGEVNDAQGVLMVALYGVCGAFAGLATWIVAHPAKNRAATLA
jgi:hypothetical protein